MYKVVSFIFSRKKFTHVDLSVISKHCFRKLTYMKKDNYKLCECCQYFVSDHSFHSQTINLSVQNITVKNEVPVPMITENEQTKSKGVYYFDAETAFHHSVLEKSSAYSNTIFRSDPYFVERYHFSDDDYNVSISTDDWENQSSYSLATNFISHGVYSSQKLNVNMDDERYDKLVSAFHSKCSSFTDDQLIDCLIALHIWPQSQHVKAENFLTVWKALDNVCYARFLDWSIDKILFMMDLWYHARLTKLSYFVFKGLRKISKNTEELTSAQMVQTLFYMSCVRKLDKSICIQEYEYYIQKYITQLSIEEIGIVALAYFKTMSYIRNVKLLVYIMQRTVEELDTIPQMTITAIAKTLRFSHKPEIGFTANDFVNKLMHSKADSMNLINTIHIMHITSKVQFFNEEAISKLAEKFCSNPDEARLKDIERVLFILSVFNYIPPSTPDILDIIIQQLDKPEHVKAGEDYPLTFLSLVYYLSLLQRFPEKPIRNLLSEDKLMKRYNNKYMIPVQLLQIDYNRVLEGPPGSEHLLSPSMRQYLAKRYSQFIPDNMYTLNNFTRMMKEVIDLSKIVLGGEQYSVISYTLPHYPRADILFRLDDNGKPVAIPENMRTMEQFGDVKWPPDPKGWYAVMIGGRNMYSHNLPRLIGEQATKLRQLRILGYTPIVIPSFNWRGEKNKEDFLRLKYFSHPG